MGHWSTSVTTPWRRQSGEIVWRVGVPWCRRRHSKTLPLVAITLKFKAKTVIKHLRYRLKVTWTWNNCDTGIWNDCDKASKWHKQKNTIQARFIRNSKHSGYRPDLKSTRKQSKATIRQNTCNIKRNTMTSALMEHNNKRKRKEKYVEVVKHYVAITEREAKTNR